MKFFSLLLALFLLYGCGQKKGPTEIVRIQKGSSLMRQVAPTLRRGGSSSNVFLIGHNVSDKQLNKYLNRHNNRNSSGYQKLYISGPKAKSKRDIRKKLSRINNRRYRIGNHKNIQDNLHKK